MQTSQTAKIYSAEIIEKIERGLEEALKEIFEMMFNEQVRIIPPTEITGTSRVSSVVGFTGAISGLLCLHLSSPMACNVASGLIGMPMEQVDETVRDAIGEMSNMMAGGLKRKLSSTDDMFKISIPSVIEGLEYTMHVPADCRQLWIGVSAGQCRFKVQLVLGAQAKH